MIVCPECGGPTRVLHTKENVKGTKRRRICDACDFRITTLEVREELFDFINEMQKLFDRKNAIFTAHKRASRPHRSKAELEAKKRGGWDLPEEKIEDWKTLRTAGYTLDEAAKAMGLRKFGTSI